MAKKYRWFFPTNTENLKMIIAQGLISNPDGFDKYYSDVLELVSGYIPVFKNQIQQEVLTYVTREEKGLISTLIEIDLKKIKGIVKKVDNEELIDVDLNDIEKEDVLFIKAPLPLSIISSMIFKSNEDKKNFQEESKLYSNVVLADLKFSSTILEQKLFKSNILSRNWTNDLKKIKIVDTHKVDYKKVYAYGGLLLNLFYFAKNGKSSNDIYKLFSDSQEDSKSQDIEIYNYFKDINKDSDDVKKKMDYGLIDIAIKSKNFKEDIFIFLESDMWDEKSKKRTEELSNKLKSFESNNDKTVSEQFNEAKTPLEKILLMLFLREDSESLMEYNKEFFNEQDYINFAMMFGIRDKFIKMPKELREFTDLQNFISLKMADHAHQTIKSDIQFSALQEVPTIVDMLNSINIKKRVIKVLEVEEAIQTVMPKRDYNHEKGKNIYVGFIEPEYKLLDDEYFKIISKKKINKIEYNKFAKMK